MLMAPISIQELSAVNIYPVTPTLFEPSLYELLADIKKEFIFKGCLESNPQLNLRILKDLLSLLKTESRQQKESVTEWKIKPELLQDLLHKFRSNKFEFGCSKRQKIKTNGKERIIYSYRTQDKIFQKFISLILNELFDDSFYSESFAYRPFRSIKQGLELMSSQSGSAKYSLKLDINKCFQSIDTGKLLWIMESRVKNPEFLRLIQKSLKTYCMIDGKKVRLPGVAQGSIHGPILCNIFLHHILDEPMRREYPQARLFRFADDILILFAEETYVNHITQWVETTLKSSGLTISSKTPNVTKETSEGLTFLGYKITRSITGLQIDIDSDRIRSKIRTLCLQEEPFDVFDYLRNRIRSTPTSLLALQSWFRLLESLPTFLTKELSTKLGATRMDTLSRNMEIELTLLIREVYNLLEQCNQGVTEFVNLRR